MTQVFDTPLFTTDQGVERLLSTGLPVLFVFTAGGAEAPLRGELNRIARERAGRLLVVLADMRDASGTARRFGVAGTPAVVGVLGGAAAAKTEHAGPADLEPHARHLLGEGPKPEGAAAGAGTAASAGEGAAKAQPVNVTDASFDAVVLKADRPVLVDFWAPWCGPCRITSPMVERLAREQGGKLIVAKVNVDDNPEVSQRFGIQSIPTMMVVRGGAIVDQWVGALPEGALRNRLAPVLS